MQVSGVVMWRRRPEWVHRVVMGDAMLAAWWQDPDFDPAQHAFYYARVIEIPRPRWTVYDAVRLDAVVPKDVPKSIQDRAYSSPIWYTPGAR